MAKKLMFIITIVLFFLIIGVVGTSYATDNINVYTYLFDGRENGKDVVDNTSGVIIDKTLPRDYGYGLGQPSSDYEVYNRITPTDEEYNESAVADISKEQLVYTVLDDSIKGKFSILYKNSGKYNGIDIDVKATLMDWSVNESCTTGFPLFGFWKEYIDSDLRFISYAKIKYEFFISGTDTPIKIKGNTTYYDIDGYQGIHILDNNKGIYATSNSQIEISDINGAPYVYDDKSLTFANEDRYNPQAAVTEIFEGTEITRVFTVAQKSEDQIICGNGGMRLNSSAITPSKVYSSNSNVGHDSKPVNIGDNISYTINYVNGEPIDSVRIQITDTLSKGLEYVTGSASLGDPTITNNSNGTTTLTWIIESFPPATVGSLTYEAKVTEDASLLVQNSATVKFNNDASYQLDPLINPIFKKEYASDTPAGKDGSLVKPNDEIKYKISYANAKSTTETIIIKDTLSKGLEYVKGSANLGEPTITNNNDGTTTLTWTSQLSSEQTESLTYSAKVTGESLIVKNNATVAVGDDDETRLDSLKNPVAKKEYASDTPAGKDGSLVKPNDEIKYKISYANAKSTTETIIIKDTLSKGLEYVTGSANLGEPTITNNNDETTTLTWTLQLSSEQTGTLTYSAKVLVVNTDVENGATIKIGNTPETTLEKLINPVMQGRGTVKINKIDSYTKEKISGVRFGIYSDSNCEAKATDYLGNPLDEKTTNENGEVEWNNLYYPVTLTGKDYYVKEISISQEYETDEVGICKKVTIKAEENEYDDDKEEVTITIENVPKGKGSVKINKTNSYTKGKISGVRFGIYSDSNCATKATDYLGNPLEEKTTNENGEVEWNNLYYPINGSKNYYIKEISISSDYESDEVGVCKRVNVNKSETTIDIENVPKGKGTVKINKTDSYTKGKISGVRFGIYSDSNCESKATDYLENPLEEKTTNANGEVEWNNLYYPINGSKDYYIKEISVPAEYEEDEVGICKKVTLKAEDNEYADDKEEVEMNIENIPKGKATILVNKIDKYTGGPISGVKFGIYQDNKCTVKATNYKGEEYEVKETNKIGMLQWEELYYPIGENGEKKYYIKEEEVPNSYTVDEEQLTNLGAENGCIEIEVKKAGEEIGLTTIEMQTLYNIPYGNITIMKRDVDTDEVIEGVEFRLLKHVPDAENNPAEDINGNIVANEVTGPNGVAEFKDIPYGDYILEEVSTNGSYEILEEPIEFTLNEDNDALKFKEQGTEALPEDELIPLETYRVGDPTDDGKIDNSDVELIEWIINQETEEEVTAKQRYASDVNGDEQVTEVDKDLVMSYIEGSTDSIPNALEEKVIPGQYQKRVTLTVTNVPIDIKISKYEIAKEKELKGAKIKILNSEGEVFYEYTSKGEREEFGISTGEYTLIEEISPKGYENLRVEIKFRVGTDGNIEIVSEGTNLYKIIRSEEENDKDMDHIIIYNKLAEVKVPNTGSTITIIGITLGIGLIGYGGYQIYRRYKKV